MLLNGLVLILPALEILGEWVNRLHLVLTLLLAVRLCLNFGLLIHLVLLHGVRQISKRLHSYMYELNALRSLYLGSHLLVVLLFEDVELLLQVLYIVQSLAVAHLDDFLGDLHTVMGHFL